MLQIQIRDKEKTILGTSGNSGDGVALVHIPSYNSGDYIVLIID